MKGEVKGKLAEYCEADNQDNCKDLWSYIMESISSGLPEADKVFEHPSKKYLQVKLG
jgi:signal transduction histidine kinase